MDKDGETIFGHTLCVKVRVGEIEICEFALSLAPKSQPNQVKGGSHTDNDAARQQKAGSKPAIHTKSNATPK
jgi:hypothetical protein